MCRHEIFYHVLQIMWHNSDQNAEFLIRPVLKPSTVLVLPDHCNIIKTIIVALEQ